MSSENLSSIFKAYDVRGIVPTELDAQRAFAIGLGFARFARSIESERDRPILVARDMRSSGSELSAAVLAGAVAGDASVIDLGLASTDLLYFASGFLGSPGVMLTASHNPAQYNGMKFCLSNAVPVGQDTGLADVLGFAQVALAHAPVHPRAPEETAYRDLLDAFADHVRSFIDVRDLAPLRVVADTANGMGGLIAPRVFSELPVELEILYSELDGTFPNHPADPIQPENLVDLTSLVLKRSADVGLAFDGDADRVFLIDELGVPLPGSTTTAIVAKAMLDRHPGATILYNCICSKSVPEVIAENGGVGIRTRVGHSFIKQVMASTGAVFGGEHSGHYYFADNYRADSGIIAALVVLQVISKLGQSLSDIRRPFERYADSGEINTRVRDADVVVAGLKEHYQNDDAVLDELDGLTVDFGTWWFNVRQSNTEPLLRLNVEAANPLACSDRVDEVLTLFSSIDPSATQSG